MKNYSASLPRRDVSVTLHFKDLDIPRGNLASLRYWFDILVAAKAEDQLLELAGGLKGVDYSAKGQDGWPSDYRSGSDWDRAKLRGKES